MGASDLPVARWGNSLAVRIPAKLAKELGVTEGSTLKAEVMGPARVRLEGKKPMDMATFIARLRELHKTMPVTEPVVEQMRRDARY
jgi:antitoxin MazE